MAFGGCVSLKDIELPEGIEIIDLETFFECKSLETIVIPEGVTKIEECAFAECTSLKNVTLPDTLHYIMAYAFYGCSSLKEIQIPAYTSTIELAAFKGCTSLESIHLHDVYYISGSLFEDCENLKTVAFSKVERIYPGAFNGCDSLEKIIFYGSQKDWDNILKDDRWDEGAGDYTFEFRNEATYLDKRYHEIPCDCGEYDYEILHEYGEWVVVEEPTEEETGLEEQTCICGAKNTKEIPMKELGAQSENTIEKTDSNKGCASSVSGVTGIAAVLLLALLVIRKRERKIFEE